MTERRKPAADTPKPPAVDVGEPPWGQEAVFAAYPLIQAFVFSRLGPQEGEDVVEKILVVLLGDLGKVTAITPSGFISWCYGVARNKVMDAWRSQRRDKILPMDPEDLVKIADAGAEAGGLSPGVRMDLDFLLKLLLQAKPPCVELLQDHVLLGVEANELAAVYGIKVDAMRRRIERCFAVANLLARKNL